MARDAIRRRFARRECVTHRIVELIRDLLCEPRRRIAVIASLDRSLRALDGERRRKHFILAANRYPVGDHQELRAAIAAYADFGVARVR